MNDLTKITLSEIEGLLQLLLRAKLVRMTALLLTAVFGAGGKAGVASKDSFGQKLLRGFFLRVEC